MTGVSEGSQQSSSLKDKGIARKDDLFLTFRANVYQIMLLFCSAQPNLVRCVKELCKYHAFSEVNDRDCFCTGIFPA
ncbi:hypothetical protein ACK3F5_17670 [Photorhabdus asymbiotica UENP]